jgi:UDP-N-acetylmuramate dehydrogenase
MIPSFIQQSISLADKNWFGTGGHSSWYAEPQTASEFSEALIFANNNKLPIFVLGEGANILISDEGFKGLTVRPALKDIQLQETSDHFLVTAGAGVRFSHLILFALENQALGLHEFSGIPGTVGGAVYMNIHYFEYLLDQFLIEAQVVDKTTGIISTVSKEWFTFGYDYSKLHEGTHFLVNATFKLKKASLIETAYAQGRHDEMIRYRARRYPQSRTCGSFFRNFFENEVHLSINNKKMIFVAYYLDKIGVKGSLVINKATVSHQHANMIVTLPGATSGDVIELARTMQTKVYDAFGVMPQPECQFIGFNEWPLFTNAISSPVLPPHHVAHP